MSGKKGRSGGARPGAGAKKRGDLAQLRELIDAHVTDADWASIFKALLIKARKGNVAAFRELRACRYGQIPIATDPAEEDDDIRVIMCDYPHEDHVFKKPEPPPYKPYNPNENKPRPTVPSSV